MTPGGDLEKTLGPLHLWALGVGYVISGMYFGWNLGLPEGGTFGLLLATLLVTVLYSTFVFCYAEMACALPRAGGAFVYARRAFGPDLAYVAGAAQLVEFLFAPPAIAAAIGAYVATMAPSVPPLAVAVGAYAVFTALNVYGVRQSAVFEMAVTAAAVAGLVLFAASTLPHFSWAAFSQEALPRGWAGALPAVPFAIWFYVAIEGVANVAEEARDPQRDMARGFGWAMVTLVVLTLLTFFGAVGASGWRSAVYADGSVQPSDSPLPLVLRRVVGDGHAFVPLIGILGLSGLVASFHGILLVAGRATFELGRTGYAPAALGRVLSGRGTPAAALVFNMVAGLIAVLTGRTGQIIVLSVFGALTLYLVSMMSFFRLRAAEPALPRPFRAPGHPFTAAIALALSAGGLAAMALSNRGIAVVYLLLLGAGWIWFRATGRQDLTRRSSHGDGPHG